MPTSIYAFLFCYLLNKDAKYGFADITNVIIKTDDNNMNITIGVRDAGIPKFASVEWYVEFKNKVDPQNYQFYTAFVAR